MRDIIFIVFTLSVGLATVHSWPSGAPVGRCDDMQPEVGAGGHGVVAQTAASPYTLTFGSNAMNYSTDDIIITISGDTLKGLLCQMRDTEGMQVGSFSTSVDNLQTLDCPGGADSGITHSNRVDKNNVMFTWSPPDSDMGELTLRCTVVKVKAEYWVGLEADQKLMYDDGSGSNSESDESDSAPAFHSGVLALMMIGAAYIMRRAFAI